MAITQPATTSLRFRSADAGDAEQIAVLHTDSWRRHYRGAYADSFLDGDLTTDRRSVWSARLSASTGTATILAELAGRPVGFIHVVLDHDPLWGSLVDNLHVVHDWQRNGIGTELLTRAAAACIDRAASRAMYLWVLEQNISAQQFYRASGATCVQTTAVSPPGGDPTRLNGTPRKLRMTWLDATQLSHPDAPVQQEPDRHIVPGDDRAHRHGQSLGDPRAGLPGGRHTGGRLDPSVAEPRGAQAAAVDRPLIESVLDLD